MVAERASLVKKLYYRILRLMLVEEHRRHNVFAFPTLLSNATFHIALLAVCSELVYYGHKVMARTFPYVLRGLKVCVIVPIILFMLLVTMCLYP